MIEYSIKQNPLTGNLTVRFGCPSCNEKLTSPLKKAGQKDYCPNCKQSFILPGQTELENELARQKVLQEQEKAEKNQKLQTKLSSQSSRRTSPPLQPPPTSNLPPIDEGIDSLTAFHVAGTSNQRATPNSFSRASKKGKAGIVDWIERLLFSFARCIAYFVVLGVLLAIGYLGFQVAKSWALVKEKKVELSEVKESVFPDEAGNAAASEGRNETKNNLNQKEFSSETPEARMRRMFGVILGVKTPPTLFEQIRKSEGESARILINAYQSLQEKTDFESLVSYSEAFLKEVNGDAKFRESMQAQRALFSAFLESQVNELNLARLKRQAAKTELSNALTSVFFLFQLFILVSVVLVLFTIERNTRP